MLIFRTGNIFNSNAFTLVNTVNTVGIMGKGIALQFKNEFPNNYKIYRSACLRKELNIGHLLTICDRGEHLGQRMIVNFPTKTHWRLPSEYTYIEKGLIALRALIISDQLQSIAVPALGCGNGGLQWNVVKSIIIDKLGGLDCSIEIFEPPQQ